MKTLAWRMNRDSPNHNEMIAGIGEAARFLEIPGTRSHVRKRRDPAAIAPHATIRCQEAAQDKQIHPSPRDFGVEALLESVSTATGKIALH